MGAVINAEGLVLGRLSSHVAKRLLNGEEIVVVNAEKAIISGSRTNVLAHYKEARARGKIRKGPNYPRVPHLLLKRTIRGMIPYQEPRGRQAFKRLRVHLGVPADLQKARLETVPEAAKSGFRSSLTLADVARGLGAVVR